MALAAEKAYEMLRAAILDGTYPPGERLGEVDLADSLGTSRTPIREALRRLEVEGLVELLPHRGARVMQWSREDIQEIYDLRALLSAFAAARAATRIDDKQLEYLRDLCELMEISIALGTEAGLERAAELNAEFHGVVLQAAASTRLAATLNVVVQLPPTLQTYHRHSPQDLLRSMAHHRELVAALQARDPAWAESVMRSHVLAGKSVTLSR